MSTNTQATETSSIERMDFMDGKYTVINNNGNLTALRYGEPWNRDLTGDNLVYAMFVAAISMKAQRDTLVSERKKMGADLDKLLAERQERVQTLHIDIKFNDAEFVRSMQTLIAEHTSEDSAQLHAAKATIEKLNAELGRVSDNLEELVEAKNTLQFENTTLQARLLEQKVAKHQPAELSGAKIIEIVESMPNGLAGFNSKWGLTLFAKAVWAAAQKGGAA